MKCEIGKWTHVAFVCEQRKAQLWIDGRPVGNRFNVEGYFFTPDPAFMIGGNHNQQQTEYFDGQIDEVRLARFAGRFKPTMLLLPDTAVSPPTVDDHNQDARTQTKRSENR